MKYKHDNKILTDKEIEDISTPFIRAVGGHFTYENAIPERDIEYFARAIENAIIKSIEKSGE